MSGIEPRYKIFYVIPHIAIARDKQWQQKRAWQSVLNDGVHAVAASMIRKENGRSEPDINRASKRIRQGVHDSTG